MNFIHERLFRSLSLFWKHFFSSMATVFYLFIHFNNQMSISKKNRIWKNRILNFKNKNYEMDTYWKEIQKKKLFIPEEFIVVEQQHYKWNMRNVSETNWQWKKWTNFENTQCNDNLIKKSETMFQCIFIGFCFGF